jgi:hypothetical protein
MFVALPVAAVLGTPSIVASQTFRRPVACDACIANWFYFDQDSSGGIQDWNCQRSTYNGHRGSDFSLAGGNGAIDRGYDVVAAAAGSVVSVQDGHYDRCGTCDASVDSRCGTGYGFGYGNHVVVNHGSYRVIYAHLRQGSVRVRPGDSVACGQTLGQIGSSGCSTGAHLHFETRPLGGASTSAFDPFAGPCSPTSPSLWVSQGGHRSMPSPMCEGGEPPPPTCPSDTYPIWTCNAARTERVRCIDGHVMTETCPYGCLGMPVGTDDVCAPPPDADGDGSRADVDCNDEDASVHPGAPEVCGDGTDQDCMDGDAMCPPPPEDAGSSPEDGGCPDQDACDAAVAPAPDGSASLPGDGGRSAELRGGGGLEGGCGCVAAGMGSSARTSTLDASSSRGALYAWAIAALAGLRLAARASHRRRGRR